MDSYLSEVYLPVREWNEPDWNSNSPPEFLISESHISKKRLHHLQKPKKGELKITNKNNIKEKHRKSIIMNGVKEMNKKEKSESEEHRIKTSEEKRKRK